MCTLRCADFFSPTPFFKPKNTFLMQIDNFFPALGIEPSSLDCKPTTIKQNMSVTCITYWKKKFNIKFKVRVGIFKNKNPFVES